MAFALEFLFDATAATHLEECPLGNDQRVTDGPDGFKRITVTVEDTEQLRWWILGYGDRIEVLGPATLRAEIGATLESAAARYD